MEQKKQGTDAQGPPRRSAAASGSLAREIARLRQMSVEERVRSALSMSQRFAWLKPAVRSLCDGYQPPGLDELVEEAERGRS